MRVALLHNASAGEGRDVDEIVARIIHLGHSVVGVVEDPAAAARLLVQPVDVVAAAGGDGTVAAAAEVIAGQDVPLAILPLGTANNIALTLGIDVPLDDLIRGWTSARRRSLDLGLIKESGVERRFVESVGVGLIAATIARASSLPSDHADRCFRTLVGSARIYRDTLDSLRPHRCTIDVDGTRFADEFLLIEVSNIPFVGPNLVIAPDANPFDGVLSVSVARESERQHLDEYLRHRIEGTDCPLSLPSHRGRSVAIDNAGCVHVDDQPYQLEPGSQVAIDIERGVVQVLVPDGC